jgi:hypothetical protein
MRQALSNVQYLQTQYEWLFHIPSCPHFDVVVRGVAEAFAKMARSESLIL